MTRRVPRILIVAPQGSIHTARWVRLIQGLEVHLFPLDDSPAHALLTGVTVHSERSAQSAGPAAMIPLGLDQESEEAVPITSGPAVLADIIERISPDLIHSMGFQPGGYLVLAARELMARRQSAKPFPTWLATNWGSDIYYFGGLPDHARQIRRLCASIDLYSVECRRDLKLGRKFGYRGPDLPVLPCSGGFDLAALPAAVKPPSQRSRIFVKGYDHFAGRALTSLQVLESLRDVIHPKYEIAVFSAGSRPRERIKELARNGTLNISALTASSHEEMLMNFSSARVYLGISVSDGISASALEAMATGAFPIQSDTSCCEEWFDNGTSGFAVSPTSLEEIRTRLMQALTDDALVDQAAIINRDIVTARLDERLLRAEVRDFYAEALAFRRN